MAGTAALLDHHGWWVAGPAGYEGPNPTPPVGPAPRHAALADVRVRTLVAPPARLDAEVEAAFGATMLAVTQRLGAYRYQAVGVEEREVARVEAWPGVGLMAAYPLAVRAWLAAEGQNAGNDTRAIVERLQDTLLITVCQGSRILAYRQTESEPAGRPLEIRRTLLGLGDEAGPVVVLAAPDLLPLNLPDFSVIPLIASCVGLRGLAHLGPRTGFVTRQAARAAATLAERARLRRRALAAGTAAALGGLAWCGGWIIERDALATHRRLVVEAARLQQEIDRLAPRRLGRLLRPLPLERIGDLLAALPPAAGLVEARVEPEGARTRLVLRFTPADPLFHDPRTLEATLKGFPGLREVDIRPSLTGDGQIAWEGTVRLEPELPR